MPLWAYFFIRFYKIAFWDVFSDYIKIKFGVVFFLSFFLKLLLWDLRLYFFVLFLYFYFLGGLGSVHGKAVTVLKKNLRRR